MFASIRSRVIVIALLVIGSIYFLFPRNTTLRERGDNGVMRDTTETKMPLKLGLDLQGGMHLALELDQSKQVSSDPKRDIDLALTVLRKRIDEFGVAEPLIQKAGDDRIVVELAGINEPARAKAIVQRSAFLEFRITDKTNALEKALPAMDRTLRGLGIKGDTSRGKPSAVEQLLGDTAKKADTATKADTTSKAAAAKTGGKDAGKPGSKAAAKPAGKDAGNAEQHDQADHQPVERLDDRGRDEAVPLKQIPKFKHRSFSPSTSNISASQLRTAQGLAPNVVPGKSGTSTQDTVLAGRARAMRVGGLRLP
jgi:preprotein translocase subunit SecD